MLRGRGVPATTIHRILYTPLYHPDYEAIAEWLTGKGERPKVEGLTEAALDRAMAFYRQHPSIPGALASAGLRGSDFIKGWKRRDEPLDIGLVDEASMLDERQYADLRQLFAHAGAVRRPGAAGAGRRHRRHGLRRRCRTRRGSTLHRVHRQAADSPILDLAHALGDPGARASPTSRRWCGRRRARDARVVIGERVDAERDGAGAGAGLAQRRRGCG